jgi:hypothetical protein
MEWLLNLDRIIEQRLAAQNTGKLVSFSSRFYFADGKIITLESQQAFRSFNDMSNELSVGIDIRWTYLIKFPLAKIPEKQEIRFVAFTNRAIAERKLENEPRQYFSSIDTEEERLGYSIQFTDVTWGEDLSSHLANYITAKTEPLPKWKNVLRRVRSTVLFPIGMFVGTLVLLWSFASSLSIDGLVKQYGPLIEVATKLQETNQKMNFLVDATVARLLMDVPIFAPVAKMALYYILAIGLFYLLLLRKSSFIGINETSRRYLNNYKKRYEIIRYSICTALLVGTAGGVFANRIYDAIKNWL